jgi:hypothetical protein
MAPADAWVMNPETLETAACAASDLTARLAAELARATAQLEDAERRYRTASAQAFTAHAPVPLSIRQDRMEGRRRVAGLLRVLGGMPTIEGGGHAQSA